MAPNKGMKLTKLVGGSVGVGPSQLIPGVRPTCSECDEAAKQAAKDVRAQ